MTVKINTGQRGFKLDKREWFLVVPAQGLKSCTFSAEL